MEGKTIEIPLRNGYTIFIDHGVAGVNVGVINTNGEIESDRMLTEESTQWLRKVVAKS